MGKLRQRGYVLCSSHGRSPCQSEDMGLVLLKPLGNVENLPFRVSVPHLEIGLPPQACYGACGLGSVENFEMFRWKVRQKHKISLQQMVNDPVGPGEILPSSDGQRI